MTDVTTKCPPLNPAQAECITGPLEKAYAIAILLSTADDANGHANTAALAMLDYLDEAHAELSKLTEASHG